jgi:AraC-like DNA-binding protein/HAMP domain-containing protein
MWFRWKQLWHWWTTQRSGKNNFYRRSLILVLCITSLPTAIIGITSYITGRAHIENEITQNHEALLKKSIARMSDNLSQLELAATQWSLDFRLDEKLRDKNLIDEYNLTQDLYRFLGVMKGAYPLIDQVHLYINQPQQPIIVSDIEGIVPVPPDQQNDWFHPLLEKDKGLFWDDSLMKVNVKGSGPYVALVKKLPNIGYTYGALIFYIDKSKLSQMVGDMVTDESGISFLMDKSGQLIVSGTNSPVAEKTDLEAALKTSVTGKTTEAGSYLFDWKGQSYTVSFGEFYRLGAPWRYVTASSLTQMTAPLVIMSRIMLAIALFGLLIAVLLSWVASNQLFRPIRRLVNVIKDSKSEPDPQGDELAFIENSWNHLRQESQALESKLELSYPSLRSAFLMQFVQGHFYSLSEPELHSRIESFGWVAESQRFVLLLVQITGFSHENGRFEESEEQLVTFAAANIAEEIVRAHCHQAEVINFQDLSVGILLSYPMDRTKQQVKEELYVLADELVRTISQLLKLQSAICIGRITSSLRDISQQLPYLRNAIRYRNLKEDYQVLNLEEMLPSANHDVQYPFALERELMHAIRMGQVEQSLKLIDEFIMELVQQSGKERMLQEGAMQVLGSILHTMLETGFHPHNLFEGENLYEQLNQLREPERIVRFFKQKVIAPYIKKLSQHQDIHMKQLVEQVTDLLKMRYMSDISLEECAETFHTTPFTLSKAFKQVNGINFIDYLTLLRIEKAKELLSNTDMKVNEIAEHIGYQPSYFIRLFRKFEDMTPGQYRDRALQGG